MTSTFTRAGASTFIVGTFVTRNREAVNDFLKAFECDIHQHDNTLPNVFSNEYIPGKLFVSANQTIEPAEDALCYCVATLFDGGNEGLRLTAQHLDQ